MARGEAAGLIDLIEKQISFTRIVNKHFHVATHTQNTGGPCVKIVEYDNLYSLNIFPAIGRSGFIGVWVCSCICAFT